MEEEQRYYKIIEEAVKGAEEAEQLTTDGKEKKLD
jgi:hypothetical protein